MKKELSTENFMTTKEVAKALGVKKVFRHPCRKEVSAKQKV